MTEILVLVDHVDGVVRKTTAELLTIARRLGEPSAVFIGDRHRRRLETASSSTAPRRSMSSAAPELTAALVAPRPRRLPSWWRPRSRPPCS